LEVVLAAMPRGVACAVDSRKTRFGSGVAPGANTFFGVFWGMLGEKGVMEGLSVVDARKIFRAVEIVDLLRLLAGCSSRVVNILRDGALWGTPRRLLFNGVET
jgi:hypothetical protein